ncbi:MAG: dihydrodipicolinate synthase family protein [Candidatus Limnocylindrales bacterium]
MATVVSRLPYTRSDAKAWGRETMRGFIEVFPTPFTADDAIDHGALRRNLEKLRGIGLNGFLSGGNIAEGWNMTPTEWMGYSESVADVLAGKTPHLASVILDPSPYTAIEKINRLADLGFNAMEVITPIFALRNDDLVYEYFKMLSEGTDVALLIYNTPASGKVLSHDLIERISDLETIVGMKHGIDSVADTARIRARVGDRMVVSNPFPRYWVLDIVEYGGRVQYGGLEFTLFAKQRPTLLEYTSLARAGKVTEAFALERAFMPLFDLYEKYLVTSVVQKGIYDMAAMKYAMGLIGFEMSGVRPPAPGVGQAEKDDIRALLTQVGVI